jgi:tetrachlorobenzoquinone reductase
LAAVSATPSPAPFFNESGYRVSEILQVRVSDILTETPDIRRVELTPLEGALPEFTAGAHIDLHLPGGVIRSYSLLNSQADQQRYLVAVALEPQSRGGSRFVHERLQVDDTIKISKPRNLFPLNESAHNSVLFGGGIGVTPMLSMASRLSALQRSWKLHYCCRTRNAAGFLGDLEKYGQHIDLHFDDEQVGFLDFGAAISSAPGAHYYCCGPKPMMAAFEAAAETQRVPRERIHIEYFQPPSDLEPQGGFEVELATSGQVIPIPLGKTILQALQEAGISTTSSCESGICGECQVKVLTGIPDHKDFVLGEAEQASNKVMMICCSGSKSDRLVLEL